MNFVVVLEKIPIPPLFGSAQMLISLLRNSEFGSNYGGFGTQTPD
jgi:hypothetical protein